jgi:type IV secretory pathway VirB2 component (pilin)
MSVRSSPTSAPRIGFLRAGQVESAFRVLLYLTLLMLVALSIIGTFYGRAGAAAPITAPLTMVLTMVAMPAALGMAVLIQVVLTLVQYGSRQFARRDRRWWFLYLVALGISVYYNYQAYWTPLGALMPGYLAFMLIVAGDVLPEFIAVRRD